MDMNLSKLGEIVEDRGANVLHIAMSLSSSWQLLSLISVCVLRVGSLLTLSFLNPQCWPSES